MFAGRVFETPDLDDTLAVIMNVIKTVQLFGGKTGTASWSDLSNLRIKNIIGAINFS